MENSPFSWIRKIKIVKISILFKAIYRFKVMPMKISITFFYRTRANNPKIYTNPQKTQNCQAILREKKSLRPNPPQIHAILQSYSNQNNMVLAQNRHRDQWKRIKSPEIKSHTPTELIFEKGGKNVQWRKDGLFSKLC